jgi:alpha/beta superfamily hydrolase
MTHDSIKEMGVQFSGPAGLIEGRLGEEARNHDNAMVVLHPHPQYGGSMENNVVVAAVRAGQACGFVTLRFNFRGVCGSEGKYDDGMGEQDDVAAALHYLRAGQSAKTAVLVGYSFGACVGLALCHRAEHGVDHLILISPPPILLPKELSLEIPVVGKIVLGEKDDIAPPEEVQSMVSAQRRKGLIEVIPKADHFFWGREEWLEASIRKSLIALL